MIPALMFGAMAIGAAILIDFPRVSTSVTVRAHCDAALNFEDMLTNSATSKHRNELLGTFF